MEITCIATAILFVLMGTAYKEVCITYILFPFAAIPMTYVLAFLFPSVSSAQTFTIFSNFFIILVQPALTLFFRNMKKLFGFGELFNMVSKVFPGYNLSAGLFFNSLHHKLVDIRKLHPGWEVSPSPWDIKNILGDWLGILFNFIFWTALLMCIETGLGTKCTQMATNMRRKNFPAPRTDIEYDNDVKEEEKRVLKIPDDKLQIKVTNLRKVYSRSSGPCNPGAPLCAVENLTFGLSRGECFGLLGVNGAGKSSTFKLLTAEEEPTAGSIKVQGLDMNTNFQ